MTQWLWLVAAWMLIVVLSTGCGESDDPEPAADGRSGTFAELEAVPQRGAPGTWVELEVDADEASVTRGSASDFERRTASGSWQVVFVLSARGAGDGSIPLIQRVGPDLVVSSVRLDREAHDVVKIPRVGPGRYRISKGVVVKPDDARQGTKMRISTRFTVKR